MNPDNTDAKQADTLIQQVKEIVVKAREQAFRQSNSILLQMYWQIGGLIVEDEATATPPSGITHLRRLPCTPKRKFLK